MTNDKETTLERIQFVTAHYRQLQGLRLVPLGVFLLLWCVLQLLGVLSTNGVSPADRAALLTRVGFASWVCLLSALAAPFYYRYRYGSVESLDHGGRSRWIAAAVVGFAFLEVVDSRLQWPVSLSALLVSGALFVTVWHDGPVRRHYLGPAFAWLVFSLRPLFDSSDLAGRSFSFGLGMNPHSMVPLYLLGGCTLIVCGIGDHLLLTRTLRGSTSRDDRGQVATV